MDTLRRGAACWALALLAPGCEPALNWRDVPAGDAVVQLPCRPKAQRRSMPLAGQMVSVQLQTCEASGITWAALDVRAPDGDAQRLVDALHQALAGNLAATTPPPAAPAARDGAASGPAAGAGSAPGAGPGPAAASPAQMGRRQLQGRREDGSGTTADVSYGVQGAQVVQLVALLPQAPDRAVSLGLEHFHASVNWTRR
jgi:hypothetical protein